MLYSHYNARGSSVYDVEALEKLHMVVGVDTDAGTVECAYEPTRLNSAGLIDTFIVKFRAIYPIFGGGVYPILFHCYGRRA